MKLDPRDCTCLKLRAATRRLTQRYDHALAPSGLRIGQFSILSFVEEYPSDPSITELAEFFDMDVSTATRNVRPLVDAGYLTMRPVAEDARRRELRLTAKGSRVLEKAYELWSQTQTSVMKELGLSRHAELHSLLESVK
jgi:DNA-binding MarR family transcriptional regulator